MSRISLFARSKETMVLVSRRGFIFLPQYVLVHGHFARSASAFRASASKSGVFTSCRFRGSASTMRVSALWSPSLSIATRCCAPVQADTQCVSDSKLQEYTVVGSITFATMMPLMVPINPPVITPDQNAFCVPFLNPYAVSIALFGRRVFIKVRRMKPLYGDIKSVLDPPNHL